MESAWGEKGRDNVRGWDIIDGDNQGLGMMKLMGKEGGVWGQIRVVRWTFGNCGEGSQWMAFVGSNRMKWIGMNIEFSNSQ